WGIGKRARRRRRILDRRTRTSQRKQCLVTVSSYLAERKDGFLWLKRRPATRPRRTLYRGSRLLDPHNGRAGIGAGAGAQQPLAAPANRQGLQSARARNSRIRIHAVGARDHGSVDWSGVDAWRPNGGDRSGVDTFDGFVAKFARREDRDRRRAGAGARRQATKDYRAGHRVVRVQHHDGTASPDGHWLEPKLLVSDRSGWSAKEPVGRHDVGRVVRLPAEARLRGGDEPGRRGFGDALVQRQGAE